MESQLSVIKNPQQLGQLYPTYIQKKRTTSNRTGVRKKLNFCLERATNYAQFLQMAQELGISPTETDVITARSPVRPVPMGVYGNDTFYPKFLGGGRDE